MEEQPDAILVKDRVASRLWELDLSHTGKVYSPKKRPANRRRQQIARFVEREGSIERFTIRQTIPASNYDVFAPPSQAQYGAVMGFFLEPCESRYQAGTLLSARDYASGVIDRYSYNASRKLFLWICTTAYILADTEMRSITRTWNISHRGQAPWTGTGAYARIHKKVTKFPARLIDDMRGAGSEIFG